jgi:hypothetical protein
MDTK